MSYKGILTATIRDLDFVQTCAACPEQYDVFDETGTIVGYVRLRWGNLTCEYPDCGGEVIYSATIGDGWSGCFDSENQRQKHLSCIADAIISHINKIQNPPVKKVFCVDNFNNAAFGTWHEGTTYDVMKYDEENEEWYIKDDNSEVGIVDNKEFKEYFDTIEEER